MQEFISNIMNSPVISFIMLMLRIITPLIAVFVVWQCYSSFRQGLRRTKPLVVLRDVDTGNVYPVLYWENSIGRSKSSDITLLDNTVSRDHAVLFRRDAGWFISDTDSKAGVYLNERQVKEKKRVAIGDVINIGMSFLELANTTDIESHSQMNKRYNKGLSSFMLMFFTSVVHALLGFQLTFGTGEFRPDGLVIFAAIFILSWLFYIVSVKILNRVSFEVETIGILLSGIGIMLLSGRTVLHVVTQFASFGIGLIVFIFLIWFMSDLERVTKFRLFFAIGSILFFVVNLVLGSTINGSTNWIMIGPISVQPSELIKIGFIIVGASTLDRLQTKKNIGEFILFAMICMGFLFVMRDFGSALIYFVGFLIIAFMRSGNLRTIALIIAAAAIGAVMIIYFMPYVAQRFAGWTNVWDHVNDSLGYQQVRTLTYMASGGFFGMGLGNGFLHYVAAAENDLVFGLMTEELGLIMGLCVLLAISLFTMYAKADATKTRSAFYSICACSAAGFLLFQTALNVFGATDVLPLTGVTLPFISMGGTSMISVWGMLAFIKASDERVYAVRRKKV